MLLALAVVPTQQAAASQFLDVLGPGAHLSLRVNAKGQAMVYYLKGGSPRHVFVRGAINARFPIKGTRQVRFKVDYSGGWKSTGRALWKTFPNACQPYDGPALFKAVAACKAPDGSYWAVQEWRVDLPDLGFPPWTKRQRSWALHVSHWTEPAARLEVYTDWVYSGRFHEVFGRATYRGHAVYGFTSTSRGAPTDGFGRLVYLDTANSKYGPGWRRENAFLAKRPNGIFCYGFFRRNPRVGGYAVPPNYRGGRRGPANGSEYRLTLLGPGVTPDVQTVVKGLGNYSRRNVNAVNYERQQNALLDQLAAGGKHCHHH